MDSSENLTSAIPAAEAEPAPAETVMVLAAKGKRDRRPAPSIRAHDFRRSGVLAANEQRKLKTRQEAFIRSLSARLGMFLRLEASLQLTQFHSLPFAQFADQLAAPSHVSPFRLEPLKGTGLLAMPCRMALALADRLLGGPGQPPAVARELTEIETSLLDQVALLILAEWCVAAPESRELRPQIAGHETRERLLQIPAGDHTFVVLSIEATLGESKDTFHLAIASSMLDSLRQLVPMTQPSAPANTPGKIAWSAQFDDLKIQSRAQWHGLSVSAGELTRLRKGDVLMFKAGTAPELQVRLANVPKFIGQAGVVGNKWAVKLTQTIA